MRRTRQTPAGKDSEIEALKKELASFASAAPTHKTTLEQDKMTLLAYFEKMGGKEDTF